MAAKNSLSSSLKQPLIALTYMQGILYSSSNSNDYPNAKTQYSAWDHNNIKKFSKTSSEFSSEYPMGQGNPADFTLPSRYLCLGAFCTCFILPKPTTLHEQATTTLSAQTFYFFPHNVLWQEGNNWPGQRTCLLPPSFICSSVHTA